MNTADRIDYFELQIGGFFYGFTRVRVEKLKNEYTLAYYPGFSNPEDAMKINISKEEYIHFLENVYACHLMDWEAEYEDPEVEDGTQWTIRLKLRDDEEREWYGCNAYPDAEYWNQFMRVVNELPIPEMDYYHTNFEIIKKRKKDCIE